MITVADLIESMKKIDEVSLLEVLDISSEEIVDRFTDKIEDKYDELKEDFEEDTEELSSERE